MVLIEVLWFVRLVLVKEAGGEAGDVAVKQIDGQSHGPVQRLRLDVRPGGRHQVEGVSGAPGIRPPSSPHTAGLVGSGALGGRTVLLGVHAPTSVPVTLLAPHLAEVLHDGPAV